ncbi:MAG: hypothetical protein IBJ01_05670 [Leptospira sp.]|uniref:hypothetical protein n=1 Tax=Leptospira sp. TaxID=178 RepID=UPI0025C38866|nr:hypothetical protein [Leptospira sp.]MBL0954238.1 hypothetical protein [Leptospira sp.]
MPTFSLYQKIGLVSLSICLWVCLPTPTKKEFKTSETIPSPFRFPRSLPPHTKIQVLDTGISLLLLGFQSGNETFSFLWDTGSNISFYEGSDSAISKEFQIGGQVVTIRRGEGILPKGIQGLVGLDFFRGTCIFWDQRELYWFSENSPFCVHPDAYLSTQLKILVTKQKGEHTFVSFEYPKSFQSFAHIDTGASLSLLPKGGDDEFLGERRVFRPGNSILIMNHWRSMEPLTLIAKSGFREDYQNVEFLTGISLENFHLSGDKDKEEGWVIGLSILRTRPLFWDFSRNRIGIIHQEN